MGGDVERLLRIEREMGHASVGAVARGRFEKMGECEETRLRREIGMGDGQGRDLRLPSPVRRMEIGSRSVAGDAAFLVIEGAAPFRVGVAWCAELQPLPERAEVGEDGVEILLGETVEHRGHGRTLVARIGIAEEGGEPVAVDALGEIDELRPLSRHGHRRSAVAVGAAEFGEEDGTALRRRGFGVEALVADDVGGGVERDGRHPKREQ